ncbi:MAG: DUF5009 domain-containing protein [Bacteroidales bacterium]|nr:DUF5009 domain-containing protein [Bacteroidales bacterium]
MDNNKRLESLDALRGFDMLFIIGFASLVVAICKLFPNGADCWLAQQMGHVSWNGLRHHDTIFPLFLYIAGISFPFSYAKQCAKGVSRGGIYRKIISRGLILVLFGLICNGLLKLHFDSLRLCSVLGRIGLAWMFAALLFINFKPKARAVIAAVILLGYWFLCMIPAPDAPGADPLSREGCLVGYIDRIILGSNHIYSDGVFDPEGLLSTLPAIVTAMLGMFTGEFVRLPEEKINGNKKTLWMFAAAAVMLVVGLIWSRWFPVNKKLWTSSFVLVVGCYSLAMFALFYWIIDVKGWNGWTLFFKVIGMNSITIFMAPRLISFGQATNFLMGGVIERCPEIPGRIVYLVTYIALQWLFLYFLYKKKIFLKV